VAAPAASALPAAAATLQATALAAGACHGCALRFAGIRDGASYLRPAAAEGAVCAVCLGVLQAAAGGGDVWWAAQLVGELDGSGYACRGRALNVSVTTPASMLVRDRLMSIHLKRQGHALAVAPVPVKEAARAAVETLVRETLGSTSEQASSLSVLIGWQAADDMGAVLRSGSGEPPPKRQRDRHQWGAKRKPRGPPPQASTAATVKLLVQLGDEKVATFCECPPLLAERCTLSPLQLDQKSVFVAGVYCKYQRGLPQSPWFVGGACTEEDGERIGEGSLEELIQADLCPMFRAALDHRFSSGGREDKDVRMLGEGRPFLFEIRNARAPAPSEQALLAAEQAINAHAAGRIKVSGLRLVTKEHTDFLRSCEDTKRKHYRCVIWTRRPIAADDARLRALGELKDLTVQQMTPVRVLHRRTAAVRPRTIHELRVDRVNEHVLLLDMVTQAGTYVKEFVHGDLGRSTPSLGSLLGSEVDIVQLDVLAIEYAAE